METRTLGKTGLKISRLGVGLAAIGEEESLETIDKVERVLSTALDSGVTFFDTAECYGISEDLIGAIGELISPVLDMNGGVLVRHILAIDVSNA